MALKNVKPNSSGGRNKSRHVTRNEAKDGARQARRKADKKEALSATLRYSITGGGTEKKDRTDKSDHYSQSVTAGEEPDVRVTNHGSIWLIHPMNGNAWTWLDTNLDPYGPRFGDSFAVEARYINDILQGLKDDGFSIA